MSWTRSLSVMSHYRKGKPAYLTEFWGSFISPDTNGSVSDWKGSESPRINHDVPVFPPQQVSPLFSDMPMANKHSLGSSVPATCHNDSETSAVRLQLVAQSRPTNAVLGIEVISLRTIGVKFPCNDESGKFSSTRREARTGSMVAENVSPKHTRSSAVAMKQDK